MKMKIKKMRKSGARRSGRTSQKRTGAAPKNEAAPGFVIGTRLLADDEPVRVAAERRANGRRGRDQRTVDEAAVDHGLLRIDTKTRLWIEDLAVGLGGAVLGVGVVHDMRDRV